MDELSELQVLLMDQQQVVEQLNETLILHDKKIQQIIQKLSLIENKLQHVLHILEESIITTSSDYEQERPPHY